MESHRGSMTPSSRSLMSYFMHIVMHGPLRGTRGPWPKVKKRNLWCFFQIGVNVNESDMVFDYIGPSEHEYEVHFGVSRTGSWLPEVTSHFPNSGQFLRIASRFRLYRAFRTRIWGPFWCISNRKLATGSDVTFSKFWSISSYSKSISAISGLPNTNMRSILVHLEPEVGYRKWRHIYQFMSDFFV
jgi:hypothetical protein